MKANKCGKRNLIQMYYLENNFELISNSCRKFTAKRSLLLCHRFCSPNWISKMVRISSEIRQKWIPVHFPLCKSASAHTFSEQIFILLFNLSFPSLSSIISVLKKSTCWPCPLFFPPQNPRSGCFPSKETPPSLVWEDIIIQTTTINIEQISFGEPSVPCSDPGANPEGPNASSFPCSHHPVPCAGFINHPSPPSTHFGEEQDQLCLLWDAKLLLQPQLWGQGYLGGKAVRKGWNSQIEWNPMRLFCHIGTSLTGQQN